VRPRPRQHRRDIRRVCAVATADPVGCKPPYIARPGDGMIACFRDAVGIGQTARPQPGQALFEPMRLEADQVKIETAEFEIPQLTAKAAVRSRVASPHPKKLLRYSTPATIEPRRHSTVRCWCDRSRLAPLIEPKGGG
jgi:hypothetical protein